MDLPTISEIYTEAHNSSHTRPRLQGDMVVNLVLDHTLIREAEHSRMHCTTTEAERVYKETLKLKTPEYPPPLWPPVLLVIFNALRKPIKDVKG